MTDKKVNQLELEKLEFSTDPVVRDQQIKAWAKKFVKEHEQEINELLGLNPDGTLKDLELEEELRKRAEQKEEKQEEPQA